MVANILERAGVAVVVDVPGIGHDYQDHNLTLLSRELILRSLLPLLILTFSR